MKEWLQDPKLLWMIGLTLFGVVIAGVRWWFNHSHKHMRIDELFAEIKADIRELKADIKTLLGRDPAIVDTGSPLHLNELGKEVSACVNAKDIAEQEAPKVIEMLPSRDPYDIQTYCKRHFSEDGEFKPSADQLDTFKRCAFDRGIKLEQVRYVCAIELRDELQRLIDSEVQVAHKDDPLTANSTVGEGQKRHPSKVV